MIKKINNAKTNIVKKTTRTEIHNIKLTLTMNEQAYGFALRKSSAKQVSSISLIKIHLARARIYKTNTELKYE